MQSTMIAPGLGTRVRYLATGSSISPLPLKPQLYISRDNARLQVEPRVTRRLANSTLVPYFRCKDIPCLKCNAALRQTRTNGLLIRCEFTSICHLQDGCTIPDDGRQLFRKRFIGDNRCIGINSDIHLQFKKSGVVNACIKL